MTQIRKVPISTSNKKVIISTGSKNLQDQLYTKDIPIIKKALNFTGKLALLKGRANYLCLQRLEHHFAAPGELTKSQQVDLVRVKQWSTKTSDGDTSKCTTVTENNPIWSTLTSSECPNYEDCYVVKARRKALNADIVVVNHHLFLADIIVKNTGFGELIPKADILIFDEAHQLPDLACQYFGQNLTSRKLLDLAKEIMLCYRTEVKDFVQLQKCADKLQKCTQDLRIAIGNISQKGNLRNLISHQQIKKEIEYLQESLNFCYEVIVLAIGRSSTLDNCVDYFSQRLGLDDAASLILDSPFDYVSQTLFCVPRYIPSPNQRNVAQQLVSILLPTIEANQGRCFFLCTSHSMMNELAKLFRENTALPILVQGETSKTQLLEQFVNYGNALLIATGSFWEGVDVRGDILSCVIIDKLPFTSPDDPFMKARIEDCVMRGGDPFNDIQIPEAVITLKQGVGRLIRHHQDHGAIIICDNRLVMRPYGAIFLNSLPPSPRARDLKKVINFLETSKNKSVY